MSSWPSVQDILFAAALTVAVFGAYVLGLASAARAYGAPVSESDRAMRVAMWSLALALVLCGVGFAVAAL